MNWNLYELRNSHNQVEYVGVSSNIEKRLYQHTKKKPDNNGNGKFYGRIDLTIYEIETYDTKAKAMQAETLYKIQLGFEPTERNAAIKSGKIVGKLSRKLTMQQAQEIKQLYATGNYTQSVLAKQFNVSKYPISNIINNKSYQE